MVFSALLAQIWVLLQHLCCWNGDSRKLFRNVFETFSLQLS